MSRADSNTSFINSLWKQFKYSCRLCYKGCDDTESDFGIIPSHEVKKQANTFARLALIDVEIRIFLPPSDRY